MAPALQISIPTTSTAAPADGKPYTLYHITLHLPLRKHEIRKRYSDFEALHNALTTQTSTTPPAPLPPKSWLRRTVNNDTLTETRRLALETYLRAILDAENPTHRSSPAWRAFLNLPSGTSTLTPNGTLSHQTPHPPSPSATADPTAWLETHRALKSHLNTARQHLAARDAAPNPHALSADAKTSLVRAASALEQLDAGLRHAPPSGKTLGAGEQRRRRDLLTGARKEIEGLEAVLRSAPPPNPTSNPSSAPGPATAEAKTALFSGANKPSGRVLGGPLKETSRTRELDNGGVLQLQQQVMTEQDEDVLSLGKTVSRLRDMGILINEELQVQTEMLGLVEQDADRVQGKIDVARRRIGKIS